MAHTYEALKPGYEDLLARMAVRPERAAAIDAAAKRLLGFYRAGKYGVVPTKTGIPVPWIAASFEREASSNFSRSPAQGDRWDSVSVNVPRGRGPFPNWTAAALDAYHLDGLDKIGADHWSWALCCYYGELFNGFGYRDMKRHPAIPSPYLWGGTNIQKRGKYIRDGVYDETVMDTQLGIIPIMKRMVELDPGVAIGKPGVVPKPSVPPPTPRKLPPPAKDKTKGPAAGGIVAGAGGLAAWFHDHWWVLAIAGVAVVIGLWAIFRPAPPPQSPKAIEP